jgi:NAD(P)H-hydrate repair Nnr-like enzyme with NAD(P)H-hydrate dehydratase domain
MTDLTPIISAALTLIMAVITTFLIPYLKTKIDANKFDKIKSWVKVAVEAAEMIYVGTGRGEEKKAYVVQYLNSKGYTLDADSINNLIESAVLELKNS